MKKKRDGDKLTTTKNIQVFTFTCETLAITVLIANKKDNALSKNKIQDMCASKRTLSIPQMSLTHNSPYKTAEVRDILMHKCTYFPASRPQIYKTFFKASTRRLYMLSKNFAKQAFARLNILSNWRPQVLGSYQKPKTTASQRIRHLNPYQKCIQCQSMICLKALVGRIRYTFALLS